MAEITSALQERQDQPKEYPILWWTTWFGETLEEGRIINNCGLPYSCKFTLDRNWYNDSKIIIAHAPSFQFDFPYLDDVKSGRKALLLNTLEAPQEFQINSKWTDIFTHMWSYSFGTADFIESYFAAGRGRGTFIESILAKPMYTIQEKNAFRKDLAPIAWIVSNCRARNGRHHYVEQLLKYIKVDIYGKCMTNREWPVHPDGRAFDAQEVMGRYKFYLSIENNNCDDYVTEKIQRPYSVGVVPILDGPKDYSRFLATNHSSIRLDDFATSKQLALRILQLDRDDAAYMKYLDYKESSTPIESLLNPRLLETYDLPQGTWGPDGDGARCGICKMAHDMAEGTYQFNSSKIIGADRTCDFTKWASISQEAELIRRETQLYWWIIALVVLAVLTTAIGIIICYKSRRARRSLQVLRSNLTLSGRREKKMANDSTSTEDYQLLTSQAED
ncbi:Alpha 1,3 fucosyltransferase [Linnemannia schmuckeri]|uniref:Fucosyltransferase n=1 Tax=Linnemannia schmuckeri TaxID=64567 RepID=A0A9P5S761_9FUNG|nr:Alpha 1,3 fucosyltransferase [Linnemannia schmuckeri]